MLDQQPTSRIRACTSRFKVRFGAGLALAALLGPPVAIAQNPESVPIPLPPSALPPTSEGRVIPPPVPVAIPSQPSTATTIPSAFQRRERIELSPTATLPPVKPIVQPTVPTVIQVDPAPASPGNLSWRSAGHQPGQGYDRPASHPASRSPDPAAGRGRGAGHQGNDRRRQGSRSRDQRPIGQTKLIETKRLLTRVAIANTAVADVELLSDQPNSRLLNIYGRSFGQTNMTLWDTEDKPVSFLIRVSLDTRDLESRIKQAYPGAVVHIRQIGSQVILEGEVADNKSVGDILQLVQTELRTSGGLRGGGGGGRGRCRRWWWRWRWHRRLGGGGGGGTRWRWGTSGGGGGGGGMSGGMVIINRIHVPGPRQVLLRVKIAELNRNAIRELGVSWFRSKDNSLIGSTIGGIAGITGTATSSLSSGALNGVIAADHINR